MFGWCIFCPGVVCLKSFPQAERYPAGQRIPSVSRLDPFVPVDITLSRQTTPWLCLVQGLIKEWVIAVQCGKGQLVVGLYTAMGDDLAIRADNAGRAFMGGLRRGGATDPQTVETGMGAQRNLEEASDAVGRKQDRVDAEALVPHP